MLDGIASVAAGAATRLRGALHSVVSAWPSLAGAAVVAAAGLYDLHRERLRRVEEADCPT